MNILFRYLIGVFLCGAMATAVPAENHGTADEAVALVKKAIVFYKANGREKTFSEINNPTGMFVQKDLYLFVGALGLGGPTMAHGANPKLVGKSLTDLKDADGVYFVRKFLDVANGKMGNGWVDYKWPNPITKQIEPKSTYVERVDDFYIACGIYK